MGRLTEIISFSLMPQSEINEEVVSRLDLNDPETRKDLIELRKQQKKAKEPLLFD